MHFVLQVTDKLKSNFSKNDFLFNQGSSNCKWIRILLPSTLDQFIFEARGHPRLISIIRDITDFR